jgi:uncharacterized delta-60 repeat protein
MKKLYSVRTIILAGSLLLQLNTLCFHSRGAPGDVDLSFDPGSGVGGTVNAVVVQPDGKVLIGGYFGTVKGLLRSNVARLNADGSGDPTFNPGTGVAGGDYAMVNSVVLQSDGKVLIGGDFTTVNGTNRNGIARLNANGSLDSGFNPGIGAAYVRSIALQPDGKVVIGGIYVNGTNFNKIARLNANGSLDSGFNPGTPADGRVFSVVLQPDGKVLVGGTFTKMNGTNRNGIARLNANGSLDSSFNPGTAYGGVYSLALQPDGKVLISGTFYLNGTNFNNIARLNANGSVDSSFNPGTSVDDEFSSIALQPDGRVLIGSYFGIGRLNADGSVDSSFNPGVIGGSVDPDYPNMVSSVVVQSDGKVLFGGDFSTVDGRNCRGIARLNADGGLDGSLNPGASIDGRVGALVVQPDGKVLIGGYFTAVNGTNRDGIARLNANGSLDSGFNPDAGANGSGVSSIALQPDGKVLIGGSFPVNGVYRGIARLNANGSLDNSFQPDLAAFIHPEDCGYANGGCLQWTEAAAVLVQADGKVLIGGYTVSERQFRPGGDIDWFQRPFLARFNANGSLDSSFISNTNFNPNLAAFIVMALQADGKVLVTGDFTVTVNGTNRSGIARLNANGSLDGSFNPGTEAWGVTSIKLQLDGKVLIGGPYRMLRDTNYPNYHAMARLNTDGSLDRTFNPAIGANDDVQSLAIQPDGKVLVTGYLTVNGTYRGIARLDAAGSLDSSFNPGPGPDAEVLSIALQSDGNVLIGGDFTIVNGVLRPHVARLYGDSVAPTLSIARSNAFVVVSWPVTGLNFQLQESTNLSLPNSWSPVAQAAVTNAGQVSVTVPTIASRKFFRLKSQ